jgi:hypothetical protein
VRKQIFATLLVAALLTPAFAFNKQKTEQQKATVTIVMASLVKGHAGCSATAIAPHVLLTAEHCNVEDGTLYLNQNHKPFANGLKVTEKYFDNNDHMVMVVPGVEFKHFIEYRADKVRPVQQGEHVYLWGNPALVMNQYREGYASGVMHFVITAADDINASGPFTTFAMPVVGGDSGSAVFSDVDGQLVGVTTWGLHDGLFLGSYPLLFTQLQIDQAEGLGNFVYVPSAAPEIAIHVAPAAVKISSGDGSSLTPWFVLFLVLFAWPTLFRVARAIGAGMFWAVKLIWRFAKAGFHGAQTR